MTSYGDNMPSLKEFIARCFGRAPQQTLSDVRPTDDWGGAPSIRALIQEIPKESLPKSMQTNLRFHKGYSGVFVGREKQLTELEKIFGNQKLRKPM